MTLYEKRILERAALLKRRIVFPDSADIRTLRAVEWLATNSIAVPLLIGSEEMIRSMADKENISLSAIEIIQPDNSPLHSEFVDYFFEMRQHKNITVEESRVQIQNSLYFAGMCVKHGIADAAVAGSLSTTGDVLRAAIQTIGLQPDISTVSSYFLMIIDDAIYAFADCAVVPSPTSLQLCDIAHSTAQNFRCIVEKEPQIAFLSFSTKGSANHFEADKTRIAWKMFAEKYPEIISDGELQADAALIPEIRNKKAPHSPIHGSANILIFPTLDAGNIAYKLTERLAGAVAVGPIVQGLKQPYCDLSRGCSDHDIILVSAISALSSVQ